MVNPCDGALPAGTGFVVGPTPSGHGSVLTASGWADVAGGANSSAGTTGAGAGPVAGAVTGVATGVAGVALSSLRGSCGSGVGGRRKPARWSARRMVASLTARRLAI